MLVPLQLTIRDIPESTAIEAKIRQQVEKLGHFCDRIVSCRVVVEAAQKHKHQGKLYTVRIDLTVPGKELVVNRILNEDLYVAIRDAFRAARRQLEDYMHREHGTVKSHTETRYGKIVRLFPQENYGFIEAHDGAEYYFHASNVMKPKFEDLKIGIMVEFLETAGGDGLQANHIIVHENIE